MSNCYRRLGCAYPGPCASEQRCKWNGQKWLPTQPEGEAKMTQHTSTDKDEADRAESLNQLLADGGDRQAAEKYLDLAAKMFNGIEGLTPVERNRLVQAAATLSINALQRAAQSDEPGEISALVALVTTTQTVLGYAATCEEPEGEADFDKVEGILGYVPDLLAAAAEIRFGEPDAPSRLVEPEVGTGNYL